VHLEVRRAKMGLYDNDQNGVCSTYRHIEKGRELGIDLSTIPMPYEDCLRCRNGKDYLCDVYMKEREAKAAMRNGNGRNGNHSVKPQGVERKVILLLPRQLPEARPSEGGA